MEMNILSDFLNNLSNKIIDAEGYLVGLQLHFGASFFIDIIVVAVIFYYAYLFLKETRALRILYGFVILLIASLLSQIFNLVLLNFILKYLSAALVVAIPIVFQPELRRALEKIGRQSFWSEINFKNNEDKNEINEIISASKVLSNRKTGALIVIERRHNISEYLMAGTEIKAKISAALLTSLFYPKSPLHDGAVVISGDKIATAGSILPVAEVEDSRNLGTRHRAAIGITSVSDAIAVVVSEETGSISIAVGGNLTRRINILHLKQRLERLLRADADKNGFGLKVRKYFKNWRKK